MQIFRRSLHYIESEPDLVQLGPAMKLSCVLCYLFSSKTQDAQTQYFCLHFCVKTVQSLLSKEHVLLFTT